MEKIICKNCGFDIATKGVAGRDTIGRFAVCCMCGKEVKKESWLFRNSKFTAAVICVRCFKKRLKRGIECPECGTVHKNNSNPVFDFCRKFVKLFNKTEQV